MARATEADRLRLRSAIHGLAQQGDLTLARLREAIPPRPKLPDDELLRALDYAVRAAWIGYPDTDTYPSKIKCDDK